MMLRVIIFVAIATFSFLSTDTAFAQRKSRVSLNQGSRFLGNGWSGGYHWRTPGYDVEYYNPYSHHNSRTKTGVIPQGSGSYLSRLGGYCDVQSGPVDVSSFDQIGSFNQSSGYHLMPAIDYSSAPGVRPNVVDSEVDVENDDRPEADDLDGPENSAKEAQESILNRPESAKPTPADRQSSPSDRTKDNKKDVSMWRGFDELESLDSSSLSGR